LLGKNRFHINQSVIKIREYVRADGTVITYRDPLKVLGMDSQSRDRDTLHKNSKR